MSTSSLHSILTQHVDSSEVAFAKIDQELAIIRSREEIRSLHAFRNTYTPIYRLPPEILTLIFSFVQHLSRLENLPRWSATSPPRWLTATQVSQHWRNVAIASPGLWSHISSPCPSHIIEEWINRSKAVPLTLNFIQRLGCKTMPFQEKHIAGSLFRVKGLYLILNQSSWNDLFPSLCSPAPLLESFRVSLDSGLTTGPILSDQIFGGKAPLLRSLRLTGCSLDLNATIMTALTSLILNSPPEKFSPTSILGAIRKLPRLHTLQLSDVLDSTAGQPVSSSHDTISLNCLKTLTIRGSPFVQSLNILSNFSFPASTKLYFECPDQTRHPLPALVSFLTAHQAARHNTPHITHLKLYDHATFSELKMGSPRSQLEDSGVPLVTFKNTVRNRYAMDITFSPQRQQLFQLLPLSTITSFETNCHIETHIWKDVFGPLQNLQTISVSDISGTTILDAIHDDCFTTCPIWVFLMAQNRIRNGSASGSQLEVTPATSDPNSYEYSAGKDVATAWTPIFPNLTRLNLTKTGFPTGGVENNQDLFSALRTRKLVGKGIKVLRISECWDVDADLVNELRKVVDRVGWDGYVKWVHSTSSSRPHDEDEDAGNVSRSDS